MLSIAFLFSFTANAQVKKEIIKHEVIQVGQPNVVNFQTLADYEVLHPVPLVQRNVEADEDNEMHKHVPNHNFVSAEDRMRNVSQVDLSHAESRAVSPAPVVSFNGLTDNNTTIPPDVNGCAGLNHLMETINSQFRVNSKTGATTSTLSITTFFSATGGSGYFDPHIVFDPYNNRWTIVIAGTLSNGKRGFMLAVSQTSDPTGSWYTYSVDAQTTSSNWMDYPTLGFNKDWIVVTGNMFTISNNSFSTSKVFVFNKTNVYAGSAGTVNSFSDNTVFTLQPCVTYDNTVGTVYMVSDWNNNSGGSGFVKLFTVSGAAASPTYSAGSTIGINQPWSATAKTAPQLGTTNKISTNDTRIMNAVYRNGSVYCAQTVFLPSTTPTRSSVQWWMINPTANTVTQFGRVDDASATTYYAFPSISVNSNNDVLLGYSVFSSSIYASSGYSYRTSSDAANTMESNYTFKSGQASYYKTYGGASNRWGDYTLTCVDPVDNSLWTLQEFAYTPANTWGTAWANVAASSGVSCGVASGQSTSSITNTTATFNWTAVAGALSYNIQYRQTGTTTWSTGTSVSASYNASGLIAGIQYEWQVQTVCTGANSVFSASTNFTTTGGTCGVATGETTSSITTTSATFSWTAVSGATSYNIQYRQIGTTTWSTGTSAGTSYNAAGLTSATQYEWQVQTICASGSSAFSTSTTFTTSSVTVTYCTANGTTTSYEWIDLVSLGTINRTSTADGGYYNGTALSTNVTIGSAYTITFSAGMSGGAYNEYWRIFIDWNHDGDFADAGETAVSTNSTSTGNLTGTFTVPAGSAVTSTRMRVALKYNSAPASCGSYTYGEVEDYTLNVSAVAAPLNQQSSFNTSVADASFTLLPNPSSGLFDVSLVNAGTNPVTIQVYDVTGRLITETITDGQTVLVNMDLSSASSGLYFVKVNFNNQIVSTKTIMKD